MHLGGDALGDLTRVVLAEGGLCEGDYVEVGECVARAIELAAGEVREQGKGAGEGEDAVGAGGGLEGVVRQVVDEAGDGEEGGGNRGWGRGNRGVVSCEL